MTTQRTLDRDASAFYTPEVLGKTRTLTPEGFLLCKDVRVARTGTMIYTQHDLPNLLPGQDGFIRVTRDADDLFHPDTLASFEGKPVTNDHPADDVTPSTWRQWAVGTMHNVRRGTGIDDTYMLADLLITEEEAIKAAHDGKREVSLGYDAAYEQTQPGHARQHSIIGNHNALVDRGRCGPRCAIQDKETTMTKPTPLERIKLAFGTRDAKEFDAAVDELGTSGGNAPSIHIHTADKSKDGDTSLEARMTKMEDSLASIAKALSTKDKNTKDESEEEDDDKNKTADELEDDDKKDKTEDDLLEEAEEDAKEKMKDADTAYASLVSSAEILAPGYKLPKLTRDAAASSKKTRDGLCACKRRALDAALKTEDGKKVVSKFLHGKTVDKLTAPEVDAAFAGATELMRALNNTKSSVKDKETTQTVDAFSQNGINTINKNFWNNRK